MQRGDFIVKVVVVIVVVVVLIGMCVLRYVLAFMLCDMFHLL
jgi:hypothetical protein